MAHNKETTGPIKVAFPYAEGVETMWVNPLGDGTYEVDNSPFEVYGISHRDVIAANSANEMLVFDHVVRRSGHSTYRVKLNVGAGHDLFVKHWPELALLGCTFEGTGVDLRRLYAIDVPHPSTVPAVHAYLQKLEENGVWEFEEAHYYQAAER